MQDLIELTAIGHLYLVHKSQVKEWIREEFSDRKKKQQRNEDFDTNAPTNKPKVRDYDYMCLFQGASSDSASSKFY